MANKGKFAWHGLFAVLLQRNGVALPSPNLPCTLKRNVQRRKATTKEMDQPKERVRICLVGSGGVGTIASVVLEKSSEVEVTVVLRTKYAAVWENGWDIESCDHGSLKGWRPSRSTLS